MAKADSDNSTSRDPGAVGRLLLYLGFNDDWHRLEPPEMDEPLRSYVTRAILRHSAVIAATNFGRLEPMTALRPVRPAIMTLSRWEAGLAQDEADDRNFLRDVVHFVDGPQANIATPFRSRIVQRLWVEFFARVAAKHLLMQGCFAADHDYRPQPVTPRLLQNRAMWLDPRDESFRPDEPGKGPDIGCLTLLEAAAYVVPDVGSPTLPPSDLRPKPSDLAVRQWFRERVDKWPNDLPAPSEEADWEAASGHFSPGLTREEFRLVRGTETPTAWHRQGKRMPWGWAKSAEIRQSAAGRIRRQF